jgi:hypothetical protein
MSEDAAWTPAETWEIYLDPIRGWESLPYIGGFDFDRDSSFFRTRFDEIEFTLKENGQLSDRLLSIREETYRKRVKQWRK